MLVQIVNLQKGDTLENIFKSLRVISLNLRFMICIQ